MNELEVGTEIISKPRISTKTIEVIEEDFDYKGFQVVRGEFFAHIYEPTFTFNNYKANVNTACVKKLPDVDYVQLMVNSQEKILVVRPCDEDTKDSLRWSSTSKTKRTPKQITCPIFFAKVVAMMNWNPEYRYKLLGKLIKSNDEYLFVFDLRTPEIYIRTSKSGEKPKISRKPTYPEEWRNQFGLPVEEHQNNLQVNIFEGFTVFSINNPEKKKQKEEEVENERFTDNTNDVNRFKEE
jgi:hypothetical protein